MLKTKKKLDRFINEVLAIDADCKHQLAFTARALVIATLPHSKPCGHVFLRQNGHYTLTMAAHPEIGLPYGSLPRLLLAWITTEAIRCKSLTLPLGKTLADFLVKLKLSRQGGERGDITRLKEQMLRLFTTHISLLYKNANQGLVQGDQFNLVRSFKLWHGPLEANSGGILPDTHITLSQDFFDEISNGPVPLNFQTLQALRRSPLQIDIYIWLTYRLSYLKQATLISWAVLKMQFGADYASDAQGLRDFKRKFKHGLRTVLFIYSAAKVEANEEGLRLLPSVSHVKKRTVTMAIRGEDNPVDKASYAR